MSSPFRIRTFVLAACAALSLASHAAPVSCGGDAVDNCEVLFTGSNGTYNASWTTTNPETFTGSEFTVAMNGLAAGNYKIDASWSGQYVTPVGVSPLNPWGGIYIEDGLGNKYLPDSTISAGPFTFSIWADNGAQAQFMAHMIVDPNVGALASQTAAQMQITATAVPEPTPLLLAGSALLAAGFFSRRKPVKVGN